MGELCPLGPARSAAGVDQGRDLVRIDLHWRGLGCCAAHDLLEPVGPGVARDVYPVTLLLFFGQGEQQPEQAGKVLLDVGDNDPLEVRVLADALDPLVELAHHHKGLRPRVFDQVFDLARDVQGVAADDDAADAPGGVGGDDELGAVGQHDGYPVAFLDAHLLQACCKAVDGVVELAVGHFGVHQARSDHGPKNDRAVVRMLGGRIRQQPVQRDAGVVYRRRHPFIVMLQPGLVHDISSLYIIVMYHLLKLGAPAIMRQFGTGRTADIPGKSIPPCRAGRDQLPATS